MLLCAAARTRQTAEVVAPGRACKPIAAAYALEMRSSLHIDEWHAIQRICDALARSPGRTRKP